MRTLGGCAALVLGLALLGCVSEASKFGMPNDVAEADLREAIRLRELAFDRYLDTNTRLQLVSQRLRVAGASLCEGELNPVLGMTLMGTREMPRIHRVVGERRYADTRLRVVSVFDGMPAAKAGVTAIRAAAASKMRRMSGSGRRPVQPRSAP